MAHREERPEGRPAPTMRMEPGRPRPAKRLRSHTTETFSPCYSNQPVDFEFRGRLHQRCAFAEMLCEFRIIIQPPKCVSRENEMRRAAATQSFKIGSHLLAVARSASVNRVSLEEVPTLSSRVVKYRRIAHVRSDNQRVGRGNSVQFQTSIAKL